jgi:CSLREA domain-containing protein
VTLLRDAYGYITVLPSTLNTAHVTLDSQTGTLLVQGRTGGQNDTITVDVVGSDIRVRVNSTTELVPTASVSQVVIARNGGSDAVDASAMVPLGIPVRDVLFVISSNQDSANAGTVGDGLVDLSMVIPGNQVALRAAIIDANALPAGSERLMYVPRGNYSLTITGTGGDTQGDLDINRTITIVSTGAGETVINGSGGVTNDRVFDVGAGGTLKLSGSTIFGGAPDAAHGDHGGAIRVNGGGTLLLAGSSIVANQTTSAAGNGGGIYFADGAGGVITNSVITANHANNFTGGIYLQAAAGPGASVTVARTIIANNTATQATGRDALAGTNRIFTSGDYNRLTSGGNGFSAAHDAIGSVNYVVTGLADTFDSANDATVRSLREAIYAANNAAGADVIWAPAWAFTLTRQRTTTLAQGDVDASHGDLDITQSLTICGTGPTGTTTVKWRLGVVDAIFDLIGDFNGDGITSPDDGQVSGTDFNIWQQTLGSMSDLRADADDNGIIQGADKDLWALYFGNTLTLTNLV